MEMQLNAQALSAQGLGALTLWMECGVKCGLRGSQKTGSRVGAGIRSGGRRDQRSRDATVGKVDSRR